MAEIIDLKNKKTEPAPNSPPMPSSSVEKTAGKEKTQSKEPLVSWKTLEYAPSTKSREWFWGVGIVAAGGVVFSFVVGNFLFSILIALATFLLFMYHVREPRLIECDISSHGIRIENRLFELEYLQSFWIFEHENGENELSIKSEKALVPAVKVSLGNTDPDVVRKALKRFIPEEHQDESLIDILARRFGF